MVNLCSKCQKVINEGESVNITIEGVYRLIASVNSFCLYKEPLIYKTDTLAHAVCVDNDNEIQ